MNGPLKNKLVKVFVALQSDLRIYSSQGGNCQNKPNFKSRKTIPTFHIRGFIDLKGTLVNWA